LSPQTPETIHQHELIGLTVEILQATDKQRIGLKGRIIDETKNLLIVAPVTAPTRRLKVPKKDCTFRFTLPTGEQVDVAGWALKGQPENRLKKIIRKRW